MKLKYFILSTFFFLTKVPKFVQIDRFHGLFESIVMYEICSESTQQFSINEIK